MFKHVQMLQSCSMRCWDFLMFFLSWSFAMLLSLFLVGSHVVLVGSYIVLVASCVGVGSTSI